MTDINQAREAAISAAMCSLGYTHGDKIRFGAGPGSWSLEFLDNADAAIAAFLKATEQVGWQSMDSAPTDRKISVVWKDRYSSGDAEGPRFSVGMTFWSPFVRARWANCPSSHWEPVAWCDFPDFDPDALPASPSLEEPKT